MSRNSSFDGFMSLASASYKSAHRNNDIIILFFGLIVWIFDKFFDLIMPKSWKVDDSLPPRDADDIDMAYISPARELLALKNQLTQGTMTTSNYVPAREATITKYQYILDDDDRTYGTWPAKHCPACYEPLPDTPKGICQKCGTPYNRTAVYEFMAAINETLI